MNRIFTRLFVILLILFFVTAPVYARKPVKLSDRQLKKVYGACIIPDPRWFDENQKTCKVSKGIDAGPLLDRAGELLYHSALPVSGGVEFVKATNGDISCFTDLAMGKSNLDQTGQCVSKVGQESINNMLEAQIDTLGTGAKLGTGVATGQFIVGSGACVARNQKANYLVGNNCIIPPEDTMQCLIDNARGAITFKGEDIPSILISGVAMKANSDMSAAGRGVGAGETGFYLWGATKFARDTDNIKRAYNIISYTASTFDISNPVGEQVYINDKLCTILDGNAKTVSCPTDYDIFTTNPPPVNSGGEILKRDENGVWNKLGYKSMEELLTDQNQDGKILIFNNNANNSNDNKSRIDSQPNDPPPPPPPPPPNPPDPPSPGPNVTNLPKSVDNQIADLTRIRDTLAKNSPQTADTIIKMYNQQIENLKAGANKASSNVSSPPPNTYVSNSSSGGGSSRSSSSGSSGGSSSGGSSSSAARSGGSSGTSSSVNASPPSASSGSVGRASSSTASEISSAARSGNISNLSPTARAVLSNR